MNKRIVNSLQRLTVYMMIKLTTQLLGASEGQSQKFVLLKLFN